MQHLGGVQYHVGLCCLEVSPKDVIMPTLVWSYRLISDVWRVSGLVSRTFYLVLLLTTLYCLFSETRVMIRLRSLRRLSPPQHLGLRELSLSDARDLIANVQHVIGAAFYLFGFVLFSNLQQIGNFADSSKASMDGRIFQNFVFHCFLAESAFFIFLCLHLSQWFVSGRVNACARRLNAQSNYLNQMI